MNSKKLSEVYKGEHFMVVEGNSLYRKLEDGYELVMGVNEDLNDETDVVLTDPHKFYAEALTEAKWFPIF